MHFLQHQPSYISFYATYCNNCCPITGYRYVVNYHLYQPQYSFELPGTAFFTKPSEMNKLKFAKDEGSEFYKELKTETERYFIEKKIDKTGGNTMLLKIILYFGLVFVFYGLMITSSALPFFYCFYLLMGFSVLLTAFNIAHDASHGVAVKSKFWNKILFSFSFNLQGNNAYVWGKNHNESHHLYTNVEGSDIDVLNNPLFRMTSTQELKWFHRYQYLYAPVLYLLYSLNWFLFRETLMIFNYSSRTIKIEIPPQEIAKLILFKLLYIGYMIVLPVLLLPFGWEHILLAFVFNHCLVSLIFVGVLGVSHVSDYVSHPEPDEDNQLNMSWPKLQMCTSVDYNPSSIFFNWTLGGFNAHALHHLLPNISHVHYLDILPIFRRLAAKHDITYMEMPYRESLAAHFRFLKVMGRQKSLIPRKTLRYKLFTIAMLIFGTVSSQEFRKIPWIGTYHDDSVTINGLSAGLFTDPDTRNKTNGLKIEMIGAGILLPLAPVSPISETREVFDSLMRQQPTSTVNGLVVSASGTICNCTTNGVSLGYVAQKNRTVNGLTASVLMNYSELHNGLQLAALFGSSYKVTGIQASVFSSSQVLDGVQIGVLNGTQQLKGLQIGLFNVSKQTKGIQLGLWNKNEKRKLPLINWNF